MHSIDGNDADLDANELEIAVVNDDEDGENYDVPEGQIVVKRELVGVAEVDADTTDTDNAADAPIFVFADNDNAATIVTAVPGTAGTEEIEDSIVVNTDLTQEEFDNVVTRNSYTFTYTVTIDTDPDEDGGDEGDSKTDDADIVLETDITIYVVKVQTALDFDRVRGRAIEGTTLSAVGHSLMGNALTYTVTGLAPNAKIISTTMAGEGVGTEDGTDDDFFVYEVDGGDILVKIGAGADPTGADEVLATITGSFVIDTDVTEDGVDGTEEDPDTDKDNDEDITLEAITGRIHVVDALCVVDATDVGVAAAECEDRVDTDDVVGAFFVKDNEASGHEIGQIVVDNRVDRDGPDAEATADDVLESIDFQIVGAGSGTFEINDDGVITVGRNASLTAGVAHELNVSVSGDAGLANRTTATMVKITVTASNQAPELLGDAADGEVEIAVDEPDKGTALLAESGTEVAGVDFSGYASDPNESLTFTDDSAVFKISSDGTTLTFGANVQKLSEGRNDPETEDVDEADDGILHAPSSSWACTDSSAANECGNIKHEFTVTVSDGVTANNMEIKVTVTLDVNDPIRVTGSLGIDGASYETTDVQNHAIVDLNDYIVGDDSSIDDVKFLMTTYPVNPPFGEYSGDIRVNYPGPTRGIADDPLTDVDESWDPEVDGWTVTVQIGDAFTNGDAPTFVNDDGDDEEYSDADFLDRDNNGGVDAVLIFTIKQIPGPPLQSYPLTFEVDENATVGAVIGSLGPHVEGAVAFSVISGTGGAQDDFAVNETTGEITVVNPRDYDAAGAENNIVLLVDAFGANGIRLGAVIAGIAIQNVNEVPEFAADAAADATVNEDAQDGAAVATIVATDQDGDTIAFSIMDGAKMPFSIDSDGNVTVKGNDAFDINVKGSYELTINASDGTLSADHMVTVTVENANDAPSFDAPVLEITIPENMVVGTEIADYDALDPDGDALTFTIKTQTDTGHFGLGAIDGKLTIAIGLDYETQQVYLVEINVSDPFEAEAEIQVLVTVTNVNDNAPEFDVMPPAVSLSVPENTARGIVLANYAATDADGDTVKYSLSGNDAKSFMISDTGDLMTLESLDADRQVPCGAGGCTVTVTANDMPDAESGAPVASHKGPATAAVVITITAIEDSVSTLDVTKANPVPGTEMGNPMSALAGTKSGGDEYLWNLLDCVGMLDLVDASDDGKQRQILQDVGRSEHDGESQGECSAY